MSVTVFATGALALDIDREIITDKKMTDNDDSSSRIIKFEELAEEILR